MIKSLKKLVTRVIGVKTGGVSKIARAMAATPFVEGFECYLPEQGDWVSDFVEQHAAFPSPGWHDDMVDTTSLALNRLGNRAMPPPRDPVGVGVEYVGKAAPQVGVDVTEAKAAWLAQQQEAKVKAQQIEQRARMRPTPPRPVAGTRKRGGV